MIESNLVYLTSGKLLVLASSVSLMKKDVCQGSVAGYIFNIEHHYTSHCSMQALAGFCSAGRKSKIPYKIKLF